MDEECTVLDKESTAESTALNEVLQQLGALKLPVGALETWKTVCADESVGEYTKKKVCFIGAKTLAKFRVPDQAYIDEWSKAPKTLKTLQQIRHPLLCGWSVEEIIDSIKPYLRKHALIYSNSIIAVEDSEQNGLLGVIDALRTDAGIASFASHCYGHIRTKIRREAKRAHLICEAEHSPVVNAIRIEVGSFLAGNWIDSQCDKLAQQWKAKRVECDGTAFITEKFSNFASILDNIITDYVAKKYPIDFKKIRKAVKKSLISEVNSQAAIDRKAHEFLTSIKKTKQVLSQLAQVAREIRAEIEAEVTVNVNNMKKTYEQWLRKRDEVKDGEKVIVNLNTSNQLRESDYELVWVQRTANNRARTWLIRESFYIADLDPNIRNDLFDWLDYKFNQRGSAPYHDKAKKYIMPIYDQVKYPTLSQVIKHVVANYEFHKNPMALDVEINDEERREFEDHNTESPDIISMAVESEALHRAILPMARKDMGLTPRQEMVMAFAYGLPLFRSEEECQRLNVISPGTVEESEQGWSYTPLPADSKGTWLAANFGQLLHDEPMDKRHICKELGCDTKCKLDGDYLNAVTRQRITQYQAAIIGKIRERFFYLLYSSKPDFKKLLELFMDSVRLSESERAVAIYHYGLNGEEEHDIEQTAKRYEYLADIDPDMDLKDRRILVKQDLESYKRKMCHAMLGLRERRLVKQA
jgi:hypothetical protein